MPYNDGTANGLAFGYLNGATKPYGKSLDIIYKEVENDLYNGLKLDYDFSLEHWAKQGVLLLNSCLTVRKGKPNSHKEIIGWERIVKKIVYELWDDHLPKVFILWGNESQSLFNDVVTVYNKTKVETNNHLVLKGKHPAADLYNRDQFGMVIPDYPKTFSGGKYFSKTNNFLKQHGRKEINW